MMKKIMIGVTALALAAGTLTVPNKADAHVWWLWPAIVGGTVGGLAIGSAAANSNYHGPRGDVYVRTRGGYCHPGREQGPDGSWHRVQVCE